MWITLDGPVIDLPDLLEIKALGFDTVWVTLGATNEATLENCKLAGLKAVVQQPRISPVDKTSIVDDPMVVKQGLNDTNRLMKAYPETFRGLLICHEAGISSPMMQDMFATLMWLCQRHHVEPVVKFDEAAYTFTKCSWFVPYAHDVSITHHIKSEYANTDGTFSPAWDLAAHVASRVAWFKGRKRRAFDGVMWEGAGWKPDSWAKLTQWAGMFRSATPAQAATVLANMGSMRDHWAYWGWFSGKDFDGLRDEPHKRKMVRRFNAGEENDVYAAMVEAMTPETRAFFAPVIADAAARGR